MAYSEQAQTTITLLQDRPLAYHPALARALGSVNAAIWLGQLMYWDGKGFKHEDGWIEKTAVDMEAETALSGYEQETARNVCMKLDVVEYDRRGLPAMPCYRIRYDQLIEVIATNGQKSRLGKRQMNYGNKSGEDPTKQDGGKAPNLVGGTYQSQDRCFPPATSQRLQAETTYIEGADAQPPADGTPTTSGTSEPGTIKTRRAGHRTTSESSGAAQRDRPRDPLFDALAELCKLDPKLKGSMIARTANNLRKVSATPEQVTRFGEWWRLWDWRGTRGQPPTPPQVETEWRKAMEWDGKPPCPKSSTPLKTGTMDRVQRAMAMVDWGGQA